VSPGAAIDGDLSELVRGEVSVAESRPRLFKSVGEAWADVVVASAAVREVLSPTPVP
jgi:ornithine cyclodeaminase